MKLAEELIRLIPIDEVINASKLRHSTRMVFNNPDFDRYTVLNQGETTKAVVVNNKDQYRIIELTTNQNLASSNMMIFNDDKNSAIEYLLDGYYEDELVAQTKAFYMRHSLSGGDVPANKLPKIKIKSDSKWIKKEKLYLWLIKEGIPDVQIKIVFPDLINLDSAETSISHGDFTLIGFDENKHKFLLSVIDDSTKLLNKAGFKDISYGKVYLATKKNSSTTRTLADYISNDDSMRVFDIKTSQEQSVLTFTHELGHRYYYKRLSPLSRELIGKEFIKNMRLDMEDQKEVNKQIRGSIPDYKVGDKIKDKKYGDLVFSGIGGVNLNSRKMVLKFHLLKNNEKTDKILTFDSMLDAILYFNKDSLKAKNKANPWLPTAYSKTSAVEWFAEIFSYSVVEKNKEILDWIKGLK